MRWWKAPKKAPPKPDYELICRLEWDLGFREVVDAQEAWFQYCRELSAARRKNFLTY